MIDTMGRLLDQWLEMDLDDNANFQCMKVLRCALLFEGFSPDNANLLACKIELKVSDNAWREHQSEITNQLQKFAGVVSKLYLAVEHEFNVDANTFIDTFGKELSYTMEI
jgi:hypothetical protein